MIRYILNYLKIIQVLVIGALFLSCGNDNPFTIESTNTNPPNCGEFTWEIEAPESFGIDGDAISSILDDAEALPYMYSIIAVKDGKMIAERYYNGKTMHDPNNIHSVTKSICSALIGIAFDRGYLIDIDSKLIKYYPEYDELPNVDPRLEDVTLRHSLTMQAGFRFYESLESWIPYVESENWTEYALQLPFIHTPGAQYHYSTPQTNLMANIIPRIYDMNTLEFANEYLFECLGIEIGYWHQDPQGNYTGGHELYLTPRDMARFGLLYLNKGNWFGSQIISTEWFRESTSRQVDRYSPFEEIMNGYGYYWRTVDQGDSHVFYALGKGGQIIYIVPDLNLLVVTAVDGDPWPISSMIGQTQMIWEIIRGIERIIKEGI